MGFPAESYSYVRMNACREIVQVERWASRRAVGSGGISRFLSESEQLILLGVEFILGEDAAIEEFLEFFDLLKVVFK